MYYVGTLSNLRQQSTEYYNINSTYVLQIMTPACENVFQS